MEEIKDNKEEKIEETADITIYNSVSSCQKPITWGTFMKLNEIYGSDIPSEMVIWYYSFRLNKYLFMHNIYVFLLHMVPGAIVDALAFLVGREPV